MGTSLRTLQVGSDNIQNNSIYARHLAEDFSDSFVSSIYPCSDYAIIWHNATKKYKRVLIKDLMLLGLSIPIIHLTPSIDFGDFHSTDIITKQFTISNYGNIVLTINSVYFPINSPSFSTNITFPIVLSPNQSIISSLTFNANLVIPHQFSCLMTFNSNDSINPKSSVILYGNQI